MAIVDVDAGKLVEGVGNAIDAIFTSDEERDEGKLNRMKLAVKPHILQAVANIKSAEHSNWFVAGARPFLLWVSGFSLLYNWLLKDFIVMVLVFTSDRSAELVPLLPKIDGNEITGLVSVLLGLGALRTYEKAKGIARK